MTSRMIEYEKVLRKEGYVRDVTHTNFKIYRKNFSLCNCHVILANLIDNSIQRIGIGGSNSCSEINQKLDEVDFNIETNKKEK